MAQNPNVNYASNTLQGRPYAADTIVPLGDYYNNEHSGDASNPSSEDRLRTRDLANTIINKAPEPWMASLQLVYNRPAQECNDLTHEWTERGLGIAGVVVLTGDSAQSASANTVNTQSITITTATQDNVGLDSLLMYPDGTIATVTAKTTNSLTLSGLYGAALPALAADDFLANMSQQLRGDAMDRIASVDRVTFSQRYNYIQTIMSAQRWGGDELQAIKNTQRVDIVQENRRAMMEHHRLYTFVTFVAGQRGAGVLSSGENARTTAGIYPQMIEAGAFIDDVTVASFKSAFEYGAANTQFRTRGRKMVIAPTAALNLFQETYKQPLTRYQNGPADGKVSLDIMQLDVMGQSFIFVPCDVFRYRDLFGDGWRNRMLFVDLDNVSLLKLKGRGFMASAVTTKDLMQGDASLRDYTYDLLISKFGVKHAFAENSFSLNITDLPN